MISTQRKALLIGIVVLLLGGGTAWVVTHFDANRYREQIQNALSDRLHRAVSIGPMAWSFRPLGVRIKNGAIGEDPAFPTGRPFAQADELYVSLAPLSLLRGRIELRSVDLRRPQIELVRNSAGRWNVSNLSEGNSGEFALKHLAISDGQVAISDVAAQEGRRTVYRNIDLTLEDYAAGRPFVLQLAVTLPGTPGTGAQRLSVRGDAGPIPAGRIERTPFVGKVEFDKVSISALERFLQVDALQTIDAVVTGAATVQAGEERVSSRGSLRFDAARVHGIDVGYPIVTAFDVAHDTKTGLLTIQPATVRLDQTPVSVNGTVHLQPDTPLLDLRINVSDASLAESARLASAFGIAFGAGTDVQGRLTTDVRARGAASRPTLEGQLQLRDARISGTGVAQPVRTPAVQLTMTPQEIRSNDFTATTNGTTVSVRFSVSAYTSTAPTLDATVRTTNADVADALNVARAWGIETANELSGSGHVTVDVRATGRASALEYTGTAAFREATLKLPLLAQPLRLRAANISFARGQAALDDVDVAIGKTNARGKLTIRNFAAPAVDFDLSADTIDLADTQALIVSSPKKPSRQPSVQNDSILLRTTGAGRLHAGALRYNQLLLENVEADARLDRGVITLQPVIASVFGGQHRGSIVVDARRTPTAFAVTSDLQKVDANRLASATTNLKDVLYGGLNSVDRVTFTTDGAGTLASSLNGTLSLNVPEGRIAHMDLIHQVGTIARFVKGHRADQQITKVRDLSAQFTVTNGLARTSDLTAKIDDDATIGGDGSINLVNQELHLRLVAVLSRQFSDIVGGASVGGIMGTVLANRRGELVVPITVTGTMQQPQFAPDVERIAEMKLRNMVPNIRNPQQWSTTIEGLVGAIKGRDAKPAKPSAEGTGEETAPPAATPSSNEPSQQIEELLRNMLGGRKKKQ